jgi:hypothetical protein
LPYIVAAFYVGLVWHLGMRLCLKQASLQLALHRCPAELC